VADNKLTVYVTANRGSSTISYSTSGRYVSLQVNDVKDLLQLQPIQPTSGSKAYWDSVLAIVQADIAAGHGGGS
jgi:hypothetical protein